jgi:kinesin family protein C1
MSTNKQAVQIETQNTEIAELKNRDETNKSRIATLEGIVEDFKASERELKELVAELEGKAREHEMLRRRLHNTIQELKGNIRVFCRVRPLLGEEKNPENISTNPFNYPPNCDNKNIDVAQGGREAVAGGQKHAGSTLNFAFDRVFGPSSTQSEVFEEISQLVQSALDGYNTCIFTYGQTGSGKTFTMEGPGKGMADLGLVRASSSTSLITTPPCSSLNRRWLTGHLVMRF